MEATRKLEFASDAADNLRMQIIVNVCDSLGICSYSKKNKVLKRKRNSCIAGVAGAAGLQQQYVAPRTWEYYDDLLKRLNKIQNTTKKYTKIIENTDVKLIEDEANKNAPKGKVLTIQQMAQQYQQNKEKERQSKKKRRKKRKRASSTPPSPNTSRNTSSSGANTAARASVASVASAPAPPPPPVPRPPIIPLNIDVYVSPYINVISNHYITCCISSFLSFKDIASARAAGKVFNKGFGHYKLDNVHDVYAPEPIVTELGTTIGYYHHVKYREWNAKGQTIYGYPHNMIITGFKKYPNDDIDVIYTHY